MNPKNRLRLTIPRIRAMPYVEFVTLLNETNRPPGGKHTVRWIARNAMLTPRHRVLEIGCNTGFSSIELSCLAGCCCVGIDPSVEAIRTARGNARAARTAPRVSFRLADGRRLPFKSGSFDFIMCGGAVAWIKEKGDAVRECRRVLRPWGMLAAVPLFYHTKPPARLLRKMNAALGITIRPWDFDYWASLFVGQGLELYHHREVKIGPVSKRRVRDYVRDLAAPLAGRVGPEVHTEIVRKAAGYFHLFNENHRYLSYSILLMRSRPSPEQPHLF